MEGSLRVQGPDNDLMDGETEGDSVVIAGQPEVLSTQAMQVSEHTHTHTLLTDYDPSGLVVLTLVRSCEGGERAGGSDR